MVKLSMPAGLLLEAAVANGLNGAYLIEVLRSKNLQALKHIGKEDSSWHYLFQYAEDNWETIIEAIQEGYTYKFITIRGLQNLIQTRFSFVENQDFCVEGTLVKLALNEEQLRFLQSRVPVQWQFLKNETEEKFNYHAALAQPQQLHS